MLYSQNNAFIQNFSFDLHLNFITTQNQNLKHIFCSIKDGHFFPPKEFYKYIFFWTNDDKDKIESNPLQSYIFI